MKQKEERITLISIKAIKFYIKDVYALFGNMTGY